MQQAVSPSRERSSRVPSTPYARRLARERGIPLASLVGTGPNGRLTAKDVLSHVPTAATPEPALASAGAVVPGKYAASPAALAATVSLEAVRTLLPQFDDFDPAIELVDVCLKAAAAALRSSIHLAGAQIALSSGEPASLQVLDGIGRLTLGAIAALRRQAGGQASPDGSPILEISWIDRDGIRPVAMPMRSKVAARLVLAGSVASNHAECLMSYDPARIDDTAAADLLLAFKTALEVPLRMIA
jgi:e3 binding domain